MTCATDVIGDVLRARKRCCTTDCAGSRNVPACTHVFPAGSLTVGTVDVLSRHITVSSRPLPAVVVGPLVVCVVAASVPELGTHVCARRIATNDSYAVDPEMS